MGTVEAVEQPPDPDVEEGLDAHAEIDGYVDEDLDEVLSGDTGPLSARVESLIPIVGRVVRARVQDATAAEDLIQETLVRVLAKANRVDPTTLEAYAIVTARNVVRSMWTERDRHRRNQHRALDMTPADEPGERLLRSVDAEAVSAALSNLSERERETLLAHEVAGRDTKSLAADIGSSAGAVAAQLNRSRARLRVEYLLSMHHVELPTPRCRPVLLALSAADRRRQAEVGAARHLLECEVCAGLSEPLMQRGQARENEVRVPIRGDADIVTARRSARELAAKLGFSATDLTVIATAVSEISRNIVRFADYGEVYLELLDEPRPGLRVVARDVGPGIADLEGALAVGYSTYSGLGLGLPGARRLMDEFDVSSEAGRGTTVTMTKWRRKGRH